MIFDILVVGGGAAGLMAAGCAAELGAGVCLLEKMERLGKKLSITGKGRCNEMCIRDRYLLRPLQAIGKKLWFCGENDVELRLYLFGPVVSGAGVFLQRLP